MRINRRHEASGAALVVLGALLGIGGAVGVGEVPRNRDGSPGSTQRTE